jgi:hypothetical protein
MPPLSGGVSLSVDEFEQLGRSADGQRQDVQSRQTRMSVHGTFETCHLHAAKSDYLGIVLQNSKNGLQRFSREKSNHATIADRCVLKRTTEVAGESIASC